MFRTCGWNPSVVRSFDLLVVLVTVRGGQSRHLNRSTRHRRRRTLGHLQHGQQRADDPVPRRLVVAQVPQHPVEPVDVELDVVDEEQNEQAGQPVKVEQLASAEAQRLGGRARARGGRGAAALAGPRPCGEPGAAAGAYVLPAGSADGGRAAARRVRAAGNDSVPSQ